MLIMNENGMKRLLSDKFTIGGEAAAAAGPVGRNTSANTDVLFTCRNLVLVPVPGIICRVVPGRRNDAA